MSDWAKRVMLETCAEVIHLISVGCLWIVCLGFILFVNSKNGNPFLAVYIICIWWVCKHLPQALRELADTYGTATALKENE